MSQQVFFAERDRDKAPEIDDVSMDGWDGWDGYAASRRRITQGWLDAKVRNALVLTGDVHRSWANAVKVDYKDPASPVVARSWAAPPSGPSATVRDRPWTRPWPGTRT